MKKLIYYGCIGEAGHYFFGPGERSLSRSERPTLFVDGEYTPKEMTKQGSARVVVVDQYIIIAWHDYTGDSRPGSNSVLLAIGYDSDEEVLKDAAEMFPSVMKRQKGPLIFYTR